MFTTVKSTIHFFIVDEVGLFQTTTLNDRVDVREVVDVLDFAVVSNSAWSGRLL